jgi:acetyl esterase/lipase
LVIFYSIEHPGFDFGRGLSDVSSLTQSIKDFNEMKRKIHLLVLTVLLFVKFAVISACQSNAPDYWKDTYTYKTVNGCEIQADVYQLPGDEIRPAILWIHPGGLITGTRDWISKEQVQFYLDAGYTVVSIDHRLAPEHKLEAIVEDIEDAYAWVQAEGPVLFNIDADRIAIVGHSAGGYLTLVAGFRLNPGPKGLVSFYGYGDISGAWVTRPDSFYNDRETISKEQAYKAVGESENACLPNDSDLDGRFDFYIYTRQQGLWAQEISGHDPNVNPEWFATYEPLQNVSATYPPTMLLHGESDIDVPFEQSVRMAEALKSHGVETTWITNPEWGHVFDSEGLSNPPVGDAFGKVIVFLDSQIK